MDLDAVDIIAFDKKFVDLQNRFRGLVAELKSRRFVANKVHSPMEKFRSNLRELYLDARIALQPSQYENFLTWINLQKKNQLQQHLNSYIGYQELSGIYKNAPVASLDRELKWITARINADRPKINAFRIKAEEVERLVFRGRLEEAITLLDSINVELGCSFWAIQLRIASESLAGGLDRQKRYTAEIRKVYKRGLLSFISYHTSVRNEDKTTIPKFIDDIKARIERHPFYDKPIKAYVTLRLTGEWPSSATDLSNILRVEQSHSLIDIYETFVGCLQEIVRSDEHRKHREAVRASIAALRDIKDFRLHKLALLLDDASKILILSKRDTSISNELFLGSVKRAALVARRAAKNDAWHQIYAGFAFAHANRKRKINLRHPQDLPRLIGRLFSSGPDGMDSYISCAKLTLNLNGLAVSAGVLELLRQLRRERPDDDWQPWLIGLNSPSIGIEDFLPNQDNIPSTLTCDQNPTVNVWRAFSGNPRFHATAASIPISRLFTAAAMIRSDKFIEAMRLIESREKYFGEGPLGILSALLLLQVNFMQGSRQEVIKLIAEEGAKGGANYIFLPIGATLKHYDQIDYKKVETTIYAPVALHLFWICEELEYTASLLRYMTKETLSQLGVDRPSKLFDRESEFAKYLLIYFLREVCIPQVIDSTTGIRGSRQVLEERQRVCADLRVLDSENAGDYEAEIAIITNQLAMDEGQWIVDRTRIHVDTAALSRWANKELSEDYDRCRDLLPLDVDVIQNFDEVLRDLMLDTPSTHSTFVAETEADVILVGVLHRLRDEFLTNSNFGLDFYLSKRIRHQSFIGLIRGPLEFANLITTRKSEGGPYHRNEYWLNKFSGLPQIIGLDEAFRKFASTFDDTLIAAKENSFQIRSAEKPNGLIYLEISPQLLALARTFVHLDVSFSDFTNIAITLLWGALEHSLVQARKFISENLKSKISADFDEFRATVKRLVEQENEFHSLDIAIGYCSANVQKELDKAATWFSHNDIEATKRNFTIDQVIKIGLDNALKCQRAFEPNIKLNIISNGDHKMSASSLVFVHDILFVALDNVKAHSGIKMPNVTVQVQPDLQKGTLTIEIISEAKVTDQPTKDKALSDIRRLIEVGDIGWRARREGGSGFLKLAAVVRQSDKGSINFGFLQDGQFCLTVTYSLIFDKAD